MQVRDLGLTVLFARIRMAGTRKGIIRGRAGLKRFRKMVVGS